MLRLSRGIPQYPYIVYLCTPAYGGQAVLLRLLLILLLAFFCLLDCSIFLQSFQIMNSFSSHLALIFYHGFVVIALRPLGEGESSS